MSGVNRGQSRNAPPLELMHLAAAGNTVVGDKYGLFFSYFLFSSFFLGQGRGGSECKGESCSNASMRWCLGLFFPPHAQPPLHCQHGDSQRQRGSAFGPAAALPVCSNIFWSDGPRAGPQTDIHMCLYGPWDVICAWSGLSHWPRRSPACWGEK